MGWLGGVNWAKCIYNVTMIDFWNGACTKSCHLGWQKWKPVALSSFPWAEPSLGGSGKPPVASDSSSASGYSVKKKNRKANLVFWEGWQLDMKPCSTCSQCQGVEVGGFKIRVSYSVPLSGFNSMSCKITLHDKASKHADAVTPGVVNTLWSVSSSPRR